jgi:dihydrofolate reductase
VTIRWEEQSKVKVQLLAAVTVDGKIARHAHELTSWTSRADKGLFARMSREAGVVIMGRRTFETLPAPLPGRLHIVLSHQVGPPRSEQVEYTNETPEHIVAQLADRGYTAAILGGGAETFRAFLAARLVDELWLTVEPLAFGHGVSLLGDAPFALNLRLLECRRFGSNSVLLRYEPARPASAGESGTSDVAPATTGAS